MVEQYTVNVLVRGSNPLLPAHKTNNTNMQTNAPALTHEELKRHEDFVYRAVTDNTVLASSAKFGRELRLTVQEIVHSNVATLRAIGTQIEKVAKDAGSSEFAAEGPLKIGGVEASKWIDFLKLQIKLTEAHESKVRTMRELRNLEAQLEEFKTPGEKRQEILDKIALLRGETIGTPEVPTT